jgi:exonuclease III
MADQPNPDYSLLSWNVRGPNNVAKQEEIKQVVQLHKPMVVCLQETKLNHFDPPLINRILGQDYNNNISFLPADGTKGGILLACKDIGYQFTDILIKEFTILVKVIERRTLSQWTLTGVYGPQDNLDKRLFLRELRGLKDSAQPAWLILGDFNLICSDQDKSNDYVDRRMISRFRRALNHIVVKEIPLVGKRFTWSNDRSSPTMTRIDRAFCTVLWEENHIDPILHPLSSSVSDHCPLLLNV